MCVSILMLSVLWRHICRHNTDNINIDTHIGTRYVILAKHWMWLSDDGFMWTETYWSSFYNSNYFNNLRILQFVFIRWKIKCLIPLLWLRSLLLQQTKRKFNLSVCSYLFVLRSITCSMLNSFFSLIFYYTEYLLCCILCSMINCCFGLSV